MTTASQDDPELVAMAIILKALESLESIEAQRRVLDWVIVRLGLSNTRAGGRGAQAPGPATSINEPLRDGTVNTVATKLGANSCRTLLVSAAAYLVLYQGREKFTRDDLISCAKTARMWKSDYGVQTSVNINRMCDSGELIEKSKDVYDLSPKKLAELEPKLAE